MRGFRTVKYATLAGFGLPRDGGDEKLQSSTSLSRTSLYIYVYIYIYLYVYSYFFYFI